MWCCCDYHDDDDDIEEEEDDDVEDDEEEVEQEEEEEGEDEEEVAEQEADSQLDLGKALTSRERYVSCIPKRSFNCHVTFHERGCVFLDDKSGESFAIVAGMVQHVVVFPDYDFYETGSQKSRREVRDSVLFVLKGFDCHGDSENTFPVPCYRKKSLQQVCWWLPTLRPHDDSTVMWIQFLTRILALNPLSSDHVTRIFNRSRAVTTTAAASTTTATLAAVSSQHYSYRSSNDDEPFVTCYDKKGYANGFLFPTEAGLLYDQQYPQFWPRSTIASMIVTSDSMYDIKVRIALQDKNVDGSTCSTNQRRVKEFRRIDREEQVALHNYIYNIFLPMTAMAAAAAITPEDKAGCASDDSTLDRRLEKGIGAARIGSCKPDEDDFQDNDSSASQDGNRSYDSGDEDYYAFIDFCRGKGDNDFYVSTDDESIESDTAFGEDAYMSSLSNEVRFMARCTKLQYNDRFVTKVDTSRFYYNGLFEGYGRQLGLALLNNDQVTSVRLHLPCLNQRDYVTTNDIDPLLHYLKRSSSLKTVSLTGQANNPLDVASVALMLMAVGESTSITSLDIRFTFSTPVPLPLHRVLPTALGSNQTLQRLCIGTSVFSNNATVETILLQLESHPFLLKLCLFHEGIGQGATATRGQFQALASLVRGTTTLRHVSLEGYHVDMESLQLVLSSLQFNPVVSKLSVLGCHLEQDATQEMIHFLQDKAPSNATTMTPVVQELSFRPVFDRRVVRTTTAFVVDSSLQVLNLRGPWHGRIAGFLDALIKRSAQVSLPTLCLQYLERSDFEALVRYMPLAVTLRRLDSTKLDPTPYHHWPDNQKQLLTALRLNGSLYRVRLQCRREIYDRESRHERVRFWKKSERIRLDAYLQQNRSLPVLLATTCVARQLSSDGNGDGARPKNAGSMDINGAPDLQEQDGQHHTSCGRTNLSLRPKLLVVASHVPRTAFTNVLRGLLANVANKTMGPRNVKNGQHTGTERHGSAA